MDCCFHQMKTYSQYLVFFLIVWFVRLFHQVNFHHICLSIYFWFHERERTQGRHKTKITYQVTSNPGGVIPTWLVNLANKDLPFKTLNKLRKLVGQKGKFSKTRKVVKYLFDFSSFFDTPFPSLERNDQERREVRTSLINEFNKSCRQGKKDACQMVKPFTLL